MEEKEIIEGNKLIAEFMCNKRLVYEETGLYAYWGPDGFEHESGAYLKYHSSWDWLMPVVEKIEKLGYDSRIMGNDSDGGYLCDFADIGNNEAACKTSYNTKIEAVWLAVIDFIEWYNTQSK